ncbi:MAG: hypothetical protein LH613_09235 [Chamaesiphon sp.]|nr:hypothetical protein [Chamaesiphon sp.]
MTTRNNRILQNRIAQICLRPKRLAAIEACVNIRNSGWAWRCLNNQDRAMSMV